MNELLKQLRESQEFMAVMDEMLKNRPVVPDYSPQSTMDETANVLERVKYYSAQRAGFDILYRNLTGNLPK